MKNISWNVHWQTDRFLAIIIRDYLRFFTENTPAIGNCVIDETIEKGNEDLYWLRWKDIVNRTADKFDELRKLIEKCPPSHEDLLKKKKLTKEAFKDLAFIFEDLNW